MAAPAPVTVYHPTLAGITRDVPKGDVEQWSAQGWRKTEPKAVKDARK